jgi:uncharacterized membrane protein SpoIIM required for sporulation
VSLPPIQEPIPEMTEPAPALRSARFRREREAAWQELEGLVAKVEEAGLLSLTAGELERLPVLYRGAAGSLSVAQAISLDRGLRDYLTALVARAYLCVYGAKAGAAGTLLDFFRRRFPVAVRAHAPFVAAAVLLLALGTAAGWRLTLADPERFYSLVGEQVSGGRTPAASTEELRSVLYSSGGAVSLLGVFATFLFTHNAKIGILSFALGFAAGVPVLFLLFRNGLVLGALAALYQSRGLGAEWWAWMLPHGITELGAVCLCGAAGLAVGTGLVFPGPHGRLRDLAERGRRASVLVIGAVAMFLVAGLVEGLFRQLVLDVQERWLAAGGTLAFWLLYFFLAGRRRRPWDR